MLQDVGWLVLAAEDPDRLAAVVTTAASQQQALDVAERELGGPTHAELGAHLLALWGLAEPIIAAVAHHHDAPVPAERELDAVAAVHIAGALISEQDEPSAGALGADYLEALGIGGCIDAWRSIAAQAHGTTVDHEDT